MPHPARAHRAAAPHVRALACRARISARGGLSDSHDPLSPTPRATHGATHGATRACLCADPAALFRRRSPPVQAAAASGAGGTAAPSAEASWKVRYGVRVQQPDGAWVAGLEASLRAGLAHTASAMRRTAESLRGGRFTPGNSMHDASELLAMALARPPADGATLPPESWPGWRPAAGVHAAQVPPALAALHDATAAAAAQGAPAAATPAEAEGRAGAEGTAAQQAASAASHADARPS